MRISGRLGKRRLLAAGVDVVIILVAYYLALVFRFAGEIPPQLSYHGASFLTFAPLAVVAHLVTNRFGRVYRIVNRYIGLVQALHVTEACIMAASFLFLVSVFWPGASHLVPLSVVVVGGLGTASAMVGVRFYGRIFHERSLINVGAGRRLLLVGAGQAADMIIREIQRNHTLRTHVVGLVDDDPHMQGMRLHQHPVLGTVEDVPQLVLHHDVSEVLVAIPSATSEQMARIHELVRPAGIPIKTLPNLASLVDGTVRFADARDLDIHDLLGRPKVEIDMEGIASYLSLIHI